MADKHPGPVPLRTPPPGSTATVVTLHGELDLATSIPLATRLDALTSQPYSDLVLDLRPVSFVDCAGLSVLCRARNRAQARRGRLRLIVDSGHVLRTLRAAGLGATFEIRPDLPTGTRPPARPTEVHP